MSGQRDLLPEISRSLTGWAVYCLHEAIIGESVFYFTDCLRSSKGRISREEKTRLIRITRGFTTLVLLSFQRYTCIYV